MKSNRGITLIALAITIIIMLIIAAIGVAALSGNSSLLTKTQEAKEGAEIKNEKSIIDLAITNVTNNNKYGELDGTELKKELETNYKKQIRSVEISGGTVEITFKSGRVYTADASGSIERDVPVAYKKVEYIKSSGTQYIMTDIIPSDTTGIYARVASHNIVTNLIWFGSNGAGNSRLWITNEKSKISLSWNEYMPTTSRPAISLDVVNTVKINFLNDRKKVYNDTEIDSNIATLNTNNYPMAIFAGNSSGSITLKSSISLYELKVSDGSKIIANFVPCYRDDDGEVGLYDTINGKFYENQGSRDFLLPN